MCKGREPYAHNKSMLTLNARAQCMGTVLLLQTWRPLSASTVTASKARTDCKGGGDAQEPCW
jgi:hypothetical protein